MLYAGSLATAYAGWYACGPIPSALARGVVRASLVAALCAPGVLIGHGIAPAPTVFALVVQPSLFTLASIGTVWIAALGVIFAVPALRRQTNGWPPRVREVFIEGYGGKFLLFGVIYAMLLLGAQTGAGSGPVAETVKYLLVLSAPGVNAWLCYLAAGSKRANPYLTPLLFAAPVLLVTPPPVALLWFGGGAVGALVARDRGRVAGGLSAAVCVLLALNFGERSFMAIDAPSHVTIEWGVAGNAAAAGVFVLLALLSWWLRPRRKTSSPRHRGPSGQAARARHRRTTGAD
jgi:hypothetical protein